MALTKVTGGTISTTSDYQINNLVGVAGTFTGNLNVEGVLTYEDVTNIDAVGLITARKGIHLGAGATVGHLSTVGVSTITSLTVNGVLTAGHRIDMTQGYQLGWKDGSTNRARIHGDSGSNFIVETGSSNTERFRIATDGDLTHTGSDNVEYKMKCGSSSGNNIIAFLNSGGTTRGNITYDSDNDFLFFNVNQSERLRIDSSGRMGLGTNNPNNPLTIHASGNHIYLKDTATNNVLQIRHASGVAEFNSYDLDGNARRDYVFNQYSSEVLRITSTGKVGIATNNPSKLLSIEGTAHTDGILIHAAGDHSTAIDMDSNRSSAAGGLAELNFKWNGTAVGQIGAYAGADTTNKDDGHIHFGTASAGTVVERLRINSSGHMILSPSGYSLPTGDERTLNIVAWGNKPASLGFQRASSLGGSTAGWSNELQSNGDLLWGVHNVGEKFRILVGGGFTLQQGNTNYPTTFVGGSTNGRNYVSVKAGNTTSGHSTGVKLNHSDASGVFSMYINHHQDHGHIMNEHQGGDILFYTNESGSSLEKVRIASDGLVNIGAGANTAMNGSGLKIYWAQYPAIQLQNSTTGTNNTDGSEILLSGDSHSGLYINNRENSIIRFGTNNTERLRITKDGDVGIGYNSPTVKLHVREGASGASSYDNRYHMICENNGEAYLGFYVPNNQYAGIRFQDTTGLEGYIDYYFNTDEMVYASTAIHRWTTAGTERLRIDAAGNLSLGKVAASSTQYGRNFQIHDTGTSGATLHLTTNDTGSANSDGFHLVQQGAHIYHWLRETGDQVLATAGTERLRIKSDGNVAINSAGTATNLLDVRKDATSVKTHIGTINGQLGSMPNSSEYGLMFVGGNAETGLYKDSSGNYSYIMGTWNNSVDIPLVFRTGNRAERMRITNDGRILIGATDSTSPAKLAVNGGISNSEAFFELNRTDDPASGQNIGIIEFNQGNSASRNAARLITRRDGGVWGASSLPTRMEFHTCPNGSNSAIERLRITSEGNVGIARTTNNHQTSGKSPTYDLSINRESPAATHDGFNKSLNVDNQYTVSTFRSTHINRHGTNQWYDIAKFVAWDFTGRIYVQSGGTFTGDQIVIDITSSYNSALGNSKSGPVIDVRRTEGHNGGRFTKVRVGCHNSNRQPIVQIYHSGNNTHNAGSWVNVTVHDYGSAYGESSHRGEARFQAATTLNETWKELEIDGGNCHYYNTSYTPSFMAYRSNVSSSIASGTFVYNAEVNERGGDNYSTTTGRFTAPCDGFYYFHANVQLYGAGTGGKHCHIQKNGQDTMSGGTSAPFYDEIAGNHGNIYMFSVLELSTNDYVTVYRNGSTRGMQCAFVGFLIR